MNACKASHLFGIACTIVASVTAASAQVVFIDNYETYPPGTTVGSAPPAPYYPTVSGSVTVQAGVAQTAPNAVHVVDTDGSLAYFRRSFVETNIMPTGRLSLDFRLDSLSLNNGLGPALEIYAPQLDNFSIPARLTSLEFFAFTSPGATNVTFRIQTSGPVAFPSFTSTFPLHSFQHIEIGWNNANLGTNGTYFATWNGITNFFYPLMKSFTNVTAFGAFDVGFGSGTYDYYVDNIVLEVPEPASLALCTLALSAMTIVRRAVKR